LPLNQLHLTGFVGHDGNAATLSGVVGDPQHGHVDVWRENLLVGLIA
jgi:hypothetical protein